MLWWQVFRRSDSARASAGPLLSRLSKVAAEGSAKAAQRVEGIQAALALALAASASAKVDSTVPASFWESLATPKAPLLSLATLARLSAQDAVSQLLLAESLLLQVTCVLQLCRVHQTRSAAGFVSFYYTWQALLSKACQQRVSKLRRGL